MLLTVKGIAKEIAQDVGRISSETDVSCTLKVLHHQRLSGG